MPQFNSPISKATNFVELNKKLSQLDITLITDSKTRTYLIRVKLIWDFFHLVYIVVNLVLLFVGNRMLMLVITTAYCQSFLTDALFYLLQGKYIAAIIVYTFVFTVVFIVLIPPILTYYLVLFFIRKFLFSFYMFLLKEKKRKKKVK